jgi:2-polyprenyl-6-hydroxyphenyl methylase/3-demethylubiquinone-9 3-methyltransferase
MLDSQAEIQAGERFAFGTNWCSFVNLVDEDRIAAAVESLTGALGTRDLTGCDFLDIGCGSGLFSLAAHRLDARVRSFDFDPESVAATRQLRARFAADSDWVIGQGSVLDADYLATLGQFDIVYSWGVLHHTGQMWRAIDLAARAVRPGGLLFISIYNDQGFESRQWRRIKRRYNQSGPVVRRLLLAASASYLMKGRTVRTLGRLARLSRGGRPAKQVRTRGMSARHDMVDWVGGYPFEVAKPEEVFSFLRERGFQLRHLKTCAGGIGCNEYVVERV